jgi:hypothetical protein
MNPLYLSGFGVELQASNLRSSKELLITDGHQDENLPERYIFRPRQCPYDSIIIEGKSGHISLQALRWLSRNNVPVFVMDFDGSVMSSILPPKPVKAVSGILSSTMAGFQFATKKHPIDSSSIMTINTLKKLLGLKCTSSSREVYSLSAD